MGEGPRSSNGTCSTLCWISVTHCASHNHIGTLRCRFPSGLACAHSRPLWVSPMTSPVRLGVSPAATPTPTGVFTQRLEALFPCAGALGLRGLLRFPPFVLVHLCANVRPQGLLVVRLPAPVHPALHQSRSCHGNASPLHPSYRSG